MDDESPPAKAEAQVLRIPKSKAKGGQRYLKEHDPVDEISKLGLGELLQLSVKMPLPALQQPSQAEDPNGATFVLSMEGFFPQMTLFLAQIGSLLLRWKESSPMEKEKVKSDCKEAKDMGYDLEVGLK